MAGSETLVATLRAEIERKYREALQALDTLSGYLSGASIPSPSPPPPLQETAAHDPDAGTRVDRVMGALSTTFKTVDDLSKELNLPEQAIRAVVYSKFVKAKIASRKIGKKMAFGVKPKAPVVKTSEVSVASLVRESLAKHPQGMTPAQVTADIAGELEKIGGAKGAVTAALYNMKKGGKVIHDENVGTYRVAS